MLSWEQRIERASEIVTVRWWFFWERQQVRGFDDEDVSLAEDWATCPCGQADQRIPRNWKMLTSNQNAGCPDDEHLSALGLKFYDAVCEDEPVRALALYRRIQQRVESLVEEIDQQVPKKKRRQKVLASGQSPVV